MAQEEAVAKPKPSIYTETKYSDKVTFMASRSPQIRLLSYPLYSLVLKTVYMLLQYY